MALNLSKLECGVDCNHHNFITIYHTKMSVLGPDLDVLFCTSGAGFWRNLRAIEPLPRTVLYWNGTNKNGRRRRTSDPWKYPGLVCTSTCVRMRLSKVGTGRCIMVVERAYKMVSGRFKASPGLHKRLGINKRKRCGPQSDKHRVTWELCPSSGISPFQRHDVVTVFFPFEDKHQFSRTSLDGHEKVGWKIKEDTAYFHLTAARMAASTIVQPTSSDKPDGLEMHSFVYLDVFFA